MLSIDGQNYLKIGNKLNVNGRYAEVGGVAENVTPQDFEEQRPLMNYDIPMWSVQNVDISYDTIVASYNLTADTTIDMTQQGIHVDKGLIKYLSDHYLSIACTNSSQTVYINKNDTHQNNAATYEFWTCPCRVTDVSQLPDITMLLWTKDSDYLSMSSKEYFSYPYYDEDYTLPSNCGILLKASVDPMNDFNYIFGQSFIRKYNLIL